MYETIEYDLTDSIATITINRPENANALNAKMAEELFDASVRCTHDGVRALIVTARGKLFCGGGDLAEFDEAGENRAAMLTRMATILHGALIRFAHMDAPVIMAINGTAGGGGFSMALSGDYVIASERAKFISAYTASGLTPDGSSTYFLAKHVGLLRAKELMFTNRLLTAEEAREWGIVNKVVAADDLQEEAQKMAQAFASGPTMAFGGLKKLLLTAYSASMETQLERETQSIAGMMSTYDGPHGVNAFLHKRKPEFKGG
jgi:2-(1,2-epoxy-1,2-dihydrophenyl)acetyl-CoA isomerase